MLENPGVLDLGSEGDGVSNARHGSEDSGYFSRRSSRAVNTSGATRDSVFLEDLNEMAEKVEREKERDDDDGGAEEADDEGAGVKDLEEEEEHEEEKEEYEHVERGREGPTVTDDDESPAQKTSTVGPTTNQPSTPEHGSRIHPPVRIGTRFISPRRPAEPRLSADEVLVARSKQMGPVT